MPHHRATRALTRCLAAATGALTLTLLAPLPAHAAVDEQLVPVCSPALPIAHPGCATGRTYRGALLPQLDENGETTVVGLGGADRWESAARAAEHGFPEADVVVLVSGEDANLVDSLSAAPLARSLAAPLLLTARDRLPDATAHFLRTHGVRSVLVVGGPGAVGEGVLQQLRDLGVASTGRVAGADRYATSRAVVALMPRAEHGWAASGAQGNLVDALAAAGPAAGLVEPVVLVPAGGDASAAAGALRALGVTSTTVAGGTAAVSEAVLRQMPGPGRAGGADRYATAAALAQEGVERGVAFDDVVVAPGANRSLVDALAGAPLGRVTLLLDDVEAAYVVAEAWVEAYPPIRATFLGAAGG